MNKERLLKLAEVLEKNSRGKRITAPGESKINFDMGLVLSRSAGCGTAACAMGYAALHPWFQRRGLKPSGNSVVYENSNNSFAAASRFFDITRDHADELFTAPDDPTPKQVAKRIRKFVADHV